MLDQLADLFLRDELRGQRPACTKPTRH